MTATPASFLADVAIKVTLNSSGPKSPCAEYVSVAEKNRVASFNKIALADQARLLGPSKTQALDLAKSAHFFPDAALLVWHKGRNNPDRGNQNEADTRTNSDKMDSIRMQGNYHRLSWRARDNCKSTPEALNRNLSIAELTPYSARASWSLVRRRIMENNASRGSTRQAPSQFASSSCSLLCVRSAMPLLGVMNIRALRASSR